MVWSLKEINELCVKPHIKCFTDNSSSPHNNLVKAWSLLCFMIRGNGEEQRPSTNLCEILQRQYVCVWFLGKCSIMINSMGLRIRETHSHSVISGELPDQSRSWLESWQHPQRRWVKRISWRNCLQGVSRIKGWWNTKDCATRSSYHPELEGGERDALTDPKDLLLSLEKHRTDNPSPAGRKPKE